MNDFSQVSLQKIYSKPMPSLYSGRAALCLLQTTDQPIIIKIAEKLMYKKLCNLLEIRKILYDLQCGFCASHSVDHVLISMTESLKDALDNKYFGFRIVVDLQKAFDTVNHEILLGKPEHYAIRGTALTWFR